MSDEEIIDLFRNRDQRAIQETSERYGRRLFQLSYKVVYDEGIAEECVNDTYLRAWDNIPPDNPDSWFYPYLVRIVRCFSIDRYRFLHRQKRGAQMEVLTDEIENCLVSSGGVDEVLDRLAFSESMNRFLEGLKKEQRIVFLRRYWYMDDISEIVSRYGFSESKVKSMLMRVRNRLRDHLIHDGILEAKQKG